MEFQTIMALLASIFYGSIVLLFIMLFKFLSLGIKALKIYIENNS